MSDGGFIPPFHNFWSWTWGDIPQLLFLNWKCKIYINIFYGFPAILSTLQPFQICIFNRKYRKVTFSNDPQLMGERFMANLHSSLDSTCKSRISKFSTRCQFWGVHFTTLEPDSWNVLKKISIGGLIPQLLILNWKCKIYIDIFYRVSCNIKHITSISDLHFQ